VNERRKELSFLSSLFSLRSPSSPTSKRPRRASLDSSLTHREGWFVVWREGRGCCERVLALHVGEKEKVISIFFSFLLFFLFFSVFLFIFFLFLHSLLFSFLSLSLRRRRPSASLLLLLAFLPHFLSDQPLPQEALDVLRLPMIHPHRLFSIFRILQPLPLRVQ